MIRLLAVAGRTFQPIMGSGQRIIGLRCMIEMPEFPPRGIVTHPTFGSERPLVPVIPVMAIKALRCSVLKRRCAMAGDAFGLAVATDQWECRQIMIEVQVCPPIRL